MDALDDRKGVLIGAVVAGLIFSQQAAARVVRDALFLSSYPAARLPVAAMAASLVAMAAVAVVSRALARLAPARLLPWVAVTASVCFLVEWKLTGMAPRAASAVLYLHYAAFGGVLISGFWSCVNERFDTLSAKNAMARIGLGASCGSLLGGAAVWAAVRLISVPAVLPVLASVSLLVAAGIHRFADGPSRPAGPAPAAEPESAIAILRRVSYLRVLALVVACGAITDPVLDYVFQSGAAAQVRSPAALASFLGLLNTTIALVALTIQAALSRRTIAKLGLAGTVAVRPTAVLMASVVGFVHPRLWTAVGARGCHDAATPSLFRSGYEPLFTPIPESEKRSTKPVVDVAVDKLGSLLGSALVLAVLALVPGHSVGALQAAVIVLCAVAVLLTPRLHRGYVATLEQNLRAGRVHLQEADVVDEVTRSTLARASLGLEESALLPYAGPTPHPDSVVQAVAHLRSGEPQRILRVLGQGELRDVLVGHVITLLERDDLVIHTVRALRNAHPTPVGQLVDILVDPQANSQVKARIPRVLRGLPGPRTVEGLALGLGDSRADVRIQCGRALSVLARRDPPMLPQAERIFAAIEGEIASSGSVPDLDHVFTLLSLTLEREPLRLALQALRGDDRADRGTALEYLATVLPPRVRRPLWPHLLDAGLRGRRSRDASSAVVPINRVALREQLQGGDSSAVVGS